MKKLGSLLLSAALVASLAVSASAFASGTQRAADAADGTWDYPWYKTTATAPSAQSGYLASNAVDGSSDTHWHTNWNTDAGDADLSDNEESRYIQLDLGEVTEIKGLRYLPRQGTSQGNENGRIIDYRVEVSTTGTEDEGAWKEVVSGTWADNADWKIAEFTPVDARYVRLYGISTRGDTGNNKFVSGAEVRVQTTQLQALVSEADGKKAEWYKSGWGAYAQAVTQGKELLASTDAGQEAMAQAVAAIQAAKGALVERDQYTAADPFVFPGQDKIATLEAEFGQLHDVVLTSDKNWNLQVSTADWASHEKYVNCFNQQDTVTYYYNAPVAGTYSVEATYRSGSTANKLAWSETNNKITAGEVAAAAESNEESQANITRTVEFELVVTEAGEGTLVFTGPDTKSPQLDKLEIRLTVATYPITVNNPAKGGTATANPTTAAAGTEVTLTQTAAEGYHFVEWQVDDETVVITDNTFTMPEKAVTITPVFAEHTYGEPEFTWAEDGKSATATFTCTCGDEQIEDAVITSAEKTPATCTEKGTTTYTATVNFGGKDYTATKDVQDIDIIAHTYGEPTFTWAEDGKSATATFTCTQCDHEETVDATITSEVTTEATCTVMGTTTYTATVNFGGKDYTATKAVQDIPTVAHTYGEPEFAWAEDGKSATATFTCTQCDHEETVDATITSEVTTEATCTVMGTTTYTATVNFGGKDYTATKAVQDIPTVAHTYGEPEFAWAEDGKSATATFTCTQCDHEETVDATVTSEVTTEATCTVMGTTTYTATVNFGGKDCTATKAVQDIPTVAHTYGEPEFAWAEDGKSATATFTCTQCDHEETVDATITSEVTTEATCTVMGTTTYTATVNFGGKDCTATKAVQDIPTVAHTYGEPEFAWAEDGKSATATFTCTQCDHEETVDATITSEVTTEATCTVMGTTTYTATVNFGGKDYTATKAVQDIPTVAHTYGEPEFAWAEDGKSATATFTCTQCDHEETVDATVTSEVTTEATCTVMGTTTYTATVNFGGKDCTATKAVQDIPTVAHTYGEPEFAWAEDGKSATATFTCTQCDHEETVDATITSEVKTEATCTVMGTNTYTATVNFGGKDYTATKAVQDIPATGHTQETIPGKEATCTQDGLTDGVKCSVCGEILVEQEVIKATGHNYVDGVCTKCGAKDPDYVPPTENPDPDPSTPVDPEPSTPVDPEPSAPVAGGDVTVDNNTDNQITVGNADQVFEANTVITVESVTQGVIFDTVKEALKDVVADMKHTAILDITATLDGKAVQPDGKVQMTFAIPENLSADNLKLFYVSDDGKTTEEIAITVNKDARTVTANLEHFSTYVLANVVASEGGKVPPTGDASQLMLYVAALAVSVSLLCGAVVVSRKRRG